MRSEFRVRSDVDNKTDLRRSLHYETRALVPSSLAFHSSGSESAAIEPLENALTTFVSFRTTAFSKRPDRVLSENYMALSIPRDEQFRVRMANAARSRAQVFSTENSLKQYLRVLGLQS